MNQWLGDIEMIKYNSEQLSWKVRPMWSERLINITISDHEQGNYKSNTKRDREAIAPMSHEPTSLQHSN